MNNFEELQSYQPDIYKEFLEMVQILKAEGKQFDSFDSFVEEVRDNQFICTLRESGVSFWKSFLKLSFDDTLTLDEKRSIINSVLAGKNRKFNTTAIKKLGEPYNSQGSMDVYFDSPKIMINFIRGRVTNPTLLLPNFIETMEKLKPGHLDYKLELTYEGNVKAKPIFTKLEYTLPNNDMFCGTYPDAYISAKCYNANEILTASITKFDKIYNFASTTRYCSGGEYV